MIIAESELRQIIRSELLREIGGGPFTLGGATSREEAEEWSQANIQGRSFSDVGPIMANAISDFVTGTVDYVVNLAVANSTLRYNLGLWLAADESVRDEDREEYLSKATDAAIELAIANLMWYGGNYLFSSLQKLAGPAWQRWTGARLVGETPPNAASNELLKKFRAEVLTDDAIQAAQPAKQQTMRDAASVIDDAIEIFEKGELPKGQTSATGTGRVAPQRGSMAVSTIDDEFSALQRMNDILGDAAVKPINIITRDGEKIIRMEKISGTNLADLMASGKWKELGPETMQSIRSQIADGLSKLHSANPPFAHGDLFMRNIMVSPSGKVKFIDPAPSLQQEFGTMLRRDLSQWRDINRYLSGPDGMEYYMYVGPGSMHSGAIPKEIWAKGAKAGFEEAM
jgi:hypothetical protein